MMNVNVLLDIKVKIAIQKKKLASKIRIQKMPYRFKLI